MLFRNRDLAKLMSLFFYIGYCGSTMGALRSLKEATEHFHCQPCIVTVYCVVASEHCQRGLFMDRSRNVVIMLDSG
jgi:hypothetical protein